MGNPAAFATAVRVAGKGGRIILVGLVAEAVETNLLGLLAHEKEIVGSSAYVDEFSEAIRLLAERRVRLDTVVTTKVPLEDTVSRGLQALLRRDEGHVKIVIAPR